MSIIWDATRYDRQPLPHEKWGEGVIERAQLCAGESLIDAGCGTGRDAELAIEQLLTLADKEGVKPGRVTLLDLDAEMLKAARERFLGYPESVAPVIIQNDLSREWIVNEPADVIISVAALHWIKDHGSVFRNAAISATEEARLHVDCGGAGNISGVIGAAGEVGILLPSWNFATVDDTVLALRSNGWMPQDVWLQEDPLVLPNLDTFRDFLSVVMFHSATESELDSLISLCSDFLIGYVRLNIDAVRDHSKSFTRDRSAVKIMAE